MFTINDIKELVELHPQVLFVKNESESYDYCRKIALGHYENFPVGSLLLPKKIRKHVFSIYAFSRLADDIADEAYPISPEERLLLLDRFMSNLILASANKTTTSNPIFLSLAATIQLFELPITPFDKLITAFKMDVKFVQPKNLDDLLNYCSYSACPIGELILRLFNEYGKENGEKSDAITSALQLINFWQDLSVDILKGRNYIPEKYSLQFLLDETEKLLNFGEDLPNLLRNRRLRLEIKVIVNAGQKILSILRKMGDELYTKRPVLRKIDYFGIIIKSIIWKS